MSSNWISNGSSRKVNQKFLRKTVKVVCDKEATYPTEVSKRVSQDPGKCGEIMRKLKKADFLETLIPKFKNSDQRLLNRKHDIDGGIKEFKKRNWYGLNSDLEWSFFDRKVGMYVNEYHQVVDPDPDRNSVLNRAVEMLDNLGD